MRSVTPSAFRALKPVDQTVLKENRKLVESVERRAFLRGTFSLGAFTMLTGCDISNKDATQSVLRAMSAWNDRVQAFLFSPTRLAREYPASRVMRPVSSDDARPFRFFGDWPSRSAFSVS